MGAVKLRLWPPRKRRALESQPLGRHANHVIFLSLPCNCLWRRLSCQKGSVGCTWVPELLTTQDPCIIHPFPTDSTTYTTNIYMVEGR